MSFLTSSTRIFQQYKSLGEKAMAQIADDQLFYQPNAESNSIAIIVQHLWGNMLSRWTDFLESDGEKPWRRRDAEFEAITSSRPAMMQQWEDGWRCLFDALASLAESDLARTVYIRGEAHTVTDAMLRQIAHYAYHVGQIVYIAKMQSATFTSLSIPKNASDAFNAAIFSKSNEAH